MTVGGEKILGSAQRRLRGAVLQHGSLILGDSVVCQGGTALARVRSEPFARATFCEDFAGELARELDLVAEPAGLTHAERARLPEFIAKYSGREWTRLR